MAREKEAINNLKNCPRFPACSINKCPLDYEAKLRTEIPGEEKCPFTLKKRGKNQKGIRILALDNTIKVISELNTGMLNKGNLKRWHRLHKYGNN
jgi:hypothetical protein